MPVEMIWANVDGFCKLEIPQTNHTLSMGGACMFYDVFDEQDEEDKAFIQNVSI